MTQAIDTLIEVMEKLRSDTGCGWDRKQTLISLKKYLLEETYELIDAIDNLAAQENEQTIHHHKEELGDVLFQIIFQSQIQSEKGCFSFNDVAQAIVDKLCRRHPHIFGDKEHDGASDDNPFWQDVKKAERPASDSALIAVPKALPSLMRAGKLGECAAYLRFDWVNVQDAWAKVEEEVAELKEALASDDRKHQAEELGDLLFALAQIARHLKLDPEIILQQGNEKFVRRFEAMIKKAGGEDLFKKLSPSQMEELWQEIKR